MPQMRKYQRGNMPKRRIHPVPSMQSSDEKTDEHADARNRQTPPQEGSHAAGDERIQPIDLEKLDMKLLFKIAREYNKSCYKLDNAFSDMCATCGRPWGTHFSHYCISWRNENKIFKEDKKLTEFFRYLRILLGKPNES